MPNKSSRLSNSKASPMKTRSSLSTSPLKKPRRRNSGKIYTENQEKIHIDNQEEEQEVEEEEEVNVEQNEHEETTNSDSEFRIKPSGNKNNSKKIESSSESEAFEPNRIENESSSFSEDSIEKINRSVSIKKTSALYKLKLKDAKRNKSLDVSNKHRRRPGRPRKRAQHGPDTTNNNSRSSYSNMSDEQEEDEEDDEDLETDELNDAKKASKKSNKNKTINNSTLSNNASFSNANNFEFSNRYIELTVPINTQQNRVVKLDTYQQIDLLCNFVKTEDENDNRENVANKQCVIAQNDVFDRYLAQHLDLYKLQQYQQKQLNDKIMTELPKTNIKTLDDHVAPVSNYKQAENFIKYMEKSAEEMDDECEYDMDEEDICWLNLINQKRLELGQTPVESSQFELFMDRLEKECYFEQPAKKPKPKKQESEAQKSQDESSINEDALCCICLDGECVNANVILFCDMCNLAVHQECYGVPYIPEGQWLCRRCISSPSAAVDCILCPNRYGAFKQTDRNQWAHVVCAIWVPECHFANTVFLEPIIGVENIDKARWKLMCYICRKKNVGACIQCDKQNCYTAFHVTCAQQAGLYMNIQEEFRGGEVRKCAYCHIHTPVETLSPATRKKMLKNNTNLEEALKQAQKLRMKRARKILQQKQNEPPQISLPMITKEKCDEIVRTKIIQSNLDDKEKFFEKLMNYWLMKRYSRFGVPLLRRLQNNVLKRNKDELGPDSSAENDEETAEDFETQKEGLKEQLRHFKKLRQDLEKLRLLMELIRKRERIKRDLVRLGELTCVYELNPFCGVFLKHLLNQLIEMDKNHIFTSAVEAGEAPDYYSVIKEPMDFGKMNEKIDRLEYDKFDQFEHDFNLIINNCLEFNSDKKSFYHKAAFKLREQASALMKQSQRCSDNFKPMSANDIHIGSLNRSHELAAATSTVKNKRSSLAKKPANDSLTNPNGRSLPARRASKLAKKSNQSDKDKDETSQFSQPVSPANSTSTSCSINSNSNFTN